MAKKINPKCLSCSKIPRDEFRMNWPECYDMVNCRRKRSYYRNLDENRLKELRWHRYLKFKSDVCFLCGSCESLEMHHVQSQASGGKDTRNNIVTLCIPCHEIITKFERKLGCGGKKKPRWIIAEEKYGVVHPNGKPELKEHESCGCHYSGGKIKCSGTECPIYRDLVCGSDSDVPKTQ